MRFTLITINTETTEVHPDETFASMEDLLAFARAAVVEWTSLVVTVLPA